MHLTLFLFVNLLAPLFRPMKEWVEPTVAWAKAKR
jgi:hypothetical protein